MFQVCYLGDGFPNNDVIASGVAFGQLDKPLTFEVRATDIDKPLLIKFVCREDSKQKPISLKLGKLHQSTWEIIFYNPVKGGTCGFNQPYGISFKDKICGLMCYIDMLQEGKHFRLTYEFYEGVLQEGAK